MFNGFTNVYIFILLQGAVCATAKESKTAFPRNLRLTPDELPQHEKETRLREKVVHRLFSIRPSNDLRPRSEYLRNGNIFLGWKQQQQLVSMCACVWHGGRVTWCLGCWWQFSSTAWRAVQLSNLNVILRIHMEEARHGADDQKSVDFFRIFVCIRARLVSMCCVKNDFHFMDTPKRKLVFVDACDSHNSLLNLLLKCWHR